jgi:hypothetical protein
MKSPDSDEVARLLEESRLADEGSAPDLATLLTRPRRSAERPHRLRPRAWAVAALAAVAAVIVLRAVRTRGGAAPEASVLSPEVVALAAWNSPTDALLDTPGSDLRTQVPDFAPEALPAEKHVPVSPTKGVD